METLQLSLYVRVVLTFLRNRSRSLFGLTGARRFLALAVVLCSIYGFVYYRTLFEPSIRRKAVVYPSILRESGISGGRLAQGVQTSQRILTPVRKVAGVTRTTPQALLVIDSTSSKSIQVLLEAQRVPFSILRVHPASERSLYDELSLEEDTNADRPFSIVIVASVDTTYAIWGRKGWEHLMAYCRVQNVPVVLFFDKDVTGSRAFVGLTGRTVSPESAQYLEPNRQSVFHYLRPGKRITALPSDALWTVFELPWQQSVTDAEASHMTLANHPKAYTRHRRSARDIGNHTPNASNKLTTFKNDSSIHESHVMKSQMAAYSREVLLQLAFASSEQPGVSLAPIAIKQRGKVEGVWKYIIGGPVSFWAVKLLLLEVLRREVGGKLLRFGSERWVMVDIDDIFVAPEGLKMTAADVRALLDAQDHFRQLVPGFTFNLGFCGSFYSRGTPQELEGSRALVGNASQVWWFGHIYNHLQPHLLTDDRLLGAMEKNKEFAEAHSIPAFDNHYSISPHHSGVYPVHLPLYAAWKSIWNISMTTTEEYPHLRPDHKRRGFIHRGIMVLPRQTCRLFTKVYEFDFFRGGRDELISFAEGGEVFDIVLNNPVSIFMTHVTNYARDRLALVLFKALLEFFTEWTQLRLLTDRPLVLGQKYFEIFPEDRLPLWNSPCRDKRHLEIWKPGNNCSRLPQLLILGPQKSGTTALHLFLLAHLDVESNRQTQDHFEEVQFFSNDTVYQRGIDWYMDQFPYPSSPSLLLFEKSATYFTHPLAPLRAHTLLPQAKLMVILHNPVDRAYSWYQHMIVHNNPAAVKYSFSEVIHASKGKLTDRKLLSLRSSCLLPGHYHEHIQRWTQYYTMDQLFFIDADELVTNPTSVMDMVQDFLGVQHVDYRSLIKYDTRKGFYCLQEKRTNGGRCLGPGKGRHYPPMSEQDRMYLDDYYLYHNLRLQRTLEDAHRSLPRWLG